MATHDTTRSGWPFSEDARATGTGQRSAPSTRSAAGLLVVLLLAVGLGGLAWPGQLARAQGSPSHASPSHADSRTVYVKLAPTTIDRMAQQGNAFPLRTTPLLQTLQARYRVRTMERVFRPAGRFEARHRAWGLHRWYRSTYDVSADAADVARAFRNTPGVETAAPAHAKQMHGRVVDVGTAPPANQPARAEPSSDGAAAPLASEPEYAKQWHYHNTGQTGGTRDADMNLPEAYATAHATPDVVVSIADSGIDLDHPEFAGMLWINAEEDINGNGVFDRTPAAEGGDLDGIDNDNNGFVDDVVGYDHADDDPIPDTYNPGNASNSHGTHVAGIVAAKNGNGQFGGSVAGGDGSPASGARLMINQVFAQRSGGFAEAIVYAADMGAVISNNSWGYTDPGVVDAPILDAIDYFRATAGGPDAPLQGGIFVTSAGNSNSGADYYPAFYSPAFAVSATEDTDRKSSFSNYGAHVDLAAPGGQFGEDGIWNTVHTEQGGFGSLSGTSMAAPHVAGALAVLISQFPGLTNDEAEALLANAGDDVRRLNAVPLGRRLDLAHALDGFDTTAPAAIADVSAAARTPSLAGATADVTWTAPGDDGRTGTATSYAVRYSLSGPIQTNAAFEAATPAGNAIVPAPSGAPESFRLDGLPFDTDVHVAVRAIDAFGNAGDVSNSASVRTPPPPALAVSPAELSVSVVTDSTASVDVDVSNTGPAGSTLVLRLIADEASLLAHASSTADTLQSGASHPFRLTVDASGADIATYSETVTLVSNDPAQPETTVPVEIAVVAPDPLPVELSGFEARRDGSTARLSWTTASETNNAGFQVQHRPPTAAAFASIGFVEGAGTTSRPQRYRFPVRDLPAGTHAFRLRQVDTDGTAALSDVVTVDVEAPRVLSLRLSGPNPVRSHTEVMFTVATDGLVDVTLYNVLGQRVRTLFQGRASVGDEQSVGVETTSLPSGMYFVRLNAPNGLRTQRIVVVQ